MQAPQISTLEAREDSTPPPAVHEGPAEPAGAITFADSDDVPPPITTSTRPTRPQRQQDGGREVYVEDNEEDELIDDDEGGSPSKTVARAEQLAMALQAAQHAIAPPAPAMSELQTPPPGSIVPKKRLYRRRDKAGGTSSTPDGGVPGSDDVDAPVAAKKRRIARAAKATLAVKRQEPDQDHASLLTWSMNEDQSQPGPDLDVNMHLHGKTAPATFAASVAPASSSPEKRRRGPRVGARDDPENGGNGSTHVQKRSKPARASVAGPSRQERAPVEEVYPQDYPTSHTSYAEQNFAPYTQHQPDVSYPPPIDLAQAISLEQFQVPEDISPEDLPSHVLEAAPRRPLPYATNAVDPANTGMWSWYAGPLDKRRSRSWGKVSRTIRTIGGGTFLSKTWIGAANSEIDHIQPPPPPLMLEQQPAVSVVSKASTPVPAKPSKPRKPRVRKTINNNGDAATGTSSAAPTPPIVKPQNAMADAAHELEMLAGGT